MGDGGCRGITIVVFEADALLCQLRLYLDFGATYGLVVLFLSETCELDLVEFNKFAVDDSCDPATA